MFGLKKLGWRTGRVGLAALIGLSALGLGASNADAQFGYTSGFGVSSYGSGRHCGTPTYSYRPVPSYNYGGYSSISSGYGGYGGYHGHGYGVPSYSSYRAITTVPALPIGGYGVGGYPRGASWGGGGFPAGPSWGGGGRGISLYIGR